LLVVSPVHGDYRRYQAEIPLIALSKFPRPALPTRGIKDLQGCLTLLQPIRFSSAPFSCLIRSVVS
jgi:hypothetical protein